jgi:hypothetical protein
MALVYKRLCSYRVVFKVSSVNLRGSLWYNSFVYCCLCLLFANLMKIYSFLKSVNH